MIRSVGAVSSRVFDVAAQILSTVAGRGLYLVLQVVLARQLGPIEFGLYCIGWTVIGLVGTLTTAGMPQAVLRFGIGGRGSLLAPPVLIAAAAGLAATLFIVFAADRMAAGLFGEPAAGPVIRAFAPAILASSIAGVMASSLRVTGAIALSAAVGTVLSVLSLGLTLAAFAVWTSAEAAAAMYSASSVLALAVTALLLRGQPATNAAPRLRALARFGLITMFIHGSNVLNIWADRLIIGIFTDAQSVAVYQVASQLAMVAVVLRSAVVTVFEAKVPKQREDGAPPDVTREFFAAARTLLHATGPGLIALALTAGFWVEWLFGAPYAAGAAPLVVLLCGQLLQTLLGPSVNALHMTGGERMALALTVGSMALNVAGNAALIPLLGTVGAAAATVAANLVVSAACLAELVRSGRLHLATAWWSDLLLGLAASGLAATASLRALTGAPPLAQACLAGVAAYAAYFAAVSAACRVEDEVLDPFRAALVRAASGARRKGRAGTSAMRAFARGVSR